MLSELIVCLSFLFCITELRTSFHLYLLLHLACKNIPVTFSLACVTAEIFSPTMSVPVILKSAAHLQQACQVCSTIVKIFCDIYVNNI